VLYCVLYPVICIEQFLQVYSWPVGLGFVFVHGSVFFIVRQKTDARYSYRLDVRMSVTRWYCVKTAQPIVKLSSLPGSPIILLF